MGNEGLGLVAVVAAIGGVGYILLKTADKKQTPTNDLAKWYQDSIDTINDLNQQVGDLKNTIVNNPAVVTVSDGIKDLPSIIEPAIDRSVKATQTIVDTIKDAGGVVSSPSKIVTTVIDDAHTTITDAMKKVVAWQVPGWMPVGEV